jgi:dihydrofolate reductase
MPLSVIVAMSENRVIGRRGGLPWHLASDLRRFKKLTMGHHLVMGRKTFESIGRLLPGRTTVVVTRQVDYDLPGAVVVHDLGQAIRLVQHEDEAFVIGGGQVFAQVLPLVDRLYLTLVHASVDGDVRFPEFDEDQWQLIQQQRFGADVHDDHDFSFRVYHRRGKPSRLGPFAK